MPFQQRTNTSCYLAIPTHGFTVVLSVFRGTPLAKPLKCKSVSNRLGARFRQRRTGPTGGKPRLSWRLNSFCAVGHHQDVVFFLLTVLCLSLSSFASVLAFAWAIKNPASIPVSRV